MTDVEVHEIIQAHERELNQKYEEKLRRLSEIGDSLREFDGEILVHLSYLHRIAGWLMNIMENHQLEYSNTLNIPDIYAIHGRLSEMLRERSHRGI